MAGFGVKPVGHAAEIAAFQEREAKSQARIENQKRSLDRLLKMRVQILALVEQLQKFGEITEEVAAQLRKATEVREKE